MSYKENSPSLYYISFKNIAECVQSWVPIHADELMLQFDFNLNPKASGLFPEGINLSPEVVY